MLPGICGSSPLEGLIKIYLKFLTEVAQAVTPTSCLYLSLKKPQSVPVSLNLCPSEWSSFILKFYVWGRPEDISSHTMLENVSKKEKKWAWVVGGKLDHH